MPAPLLIRRTGAGTPPSLAAQMNGVNQYLSIADNAALSLGADTPFTITGRYRFDTIGAVQNMVTKSDGTQSAGIEWVLRLNSVLHRIQFFIGNGTTSTSVDAATLGAPNAGQWYFVAIWHDNVADTISIQVDNGGVDSAAWANGTHDTANAFEIGATQTGTQPLSGAVDEVAYWQRVLTSGERTQLYNGGRPLRFFQAPGSLKASLVDWWPLDGNANGAFGGNNLTNNNGVTFIST